MKRILLCPPDYYDIEYEINPWMHVSNKVNKSSVQKAYSSIKNTYKELGVTTYEIEPAKGLPDMVYTANFGQVSGNKFIKSNFKYKERRREADLAADYFKKQFSLEPVSLPENIYFEGQGDLLNDGNRFFFGWGKRSDRKAISYLEKFLGSEVVDFELINPYFYHLDTALTPISSEIVVYNPESFTEEGINKIQSTFKKCIPTNKTDSAVIACNMVMVDRNVVHGAGISAELSNTLRDLGYRLYPIDTTEYIKGGGSVKLCDCYHIWRIEFTAFTAAIGQIFVILMLLLVTFSFPK